MFEANKTFLNYTVAFELHRAFNKYLHIEANKTLLNHTVVFTLHRDFNKYLQIVLILK